MSLYLPYLLFFIVFLAQLWIIKRLDARLENLLDRTMHMSDTLLAYKAKSDDQLYWIDPETADMRPVYRGERASTEDVEGTHE